MIRFFKLTFLCWVFLAFHPVFGESGNDCENAVVINPISCDVFNNTNITGTIAPSCIGAGKNNSMWFSFIADSSGTTISVDGGAGNLPIKNCSVALFESSMDCNGSFLELDCSSSDDDFTEITNYTLVPNNTYYILLDGKNNNQGTFRLCLNSFSVHSISIKGKVSQKMTTLRGLQNMLITIKDERGAFVTSVTTDHAGIFEFRKLQPNKNYILSLDEKNPRFDHNVKYVIAGHVFANNGKKSTTQDMQIFFGYRYDEKLFAMVTDHTGHYRFEYLPAEHYGLPLMEETDDPWNHLSSATTKKESPAVITEPFCFDAASYELMPDAKKTLDKVVVFLNSDPKSVLKICVFTDSRGSEKENLKLSKKRAGAALKYLVEKGVDKLRLSTEGMGETNLLNRCKDGADCSEEEHRKNQRAVFKVSWKE